MGRPLNGVNFSRIQFSFNKILNVQKIPEMSKCTRHVQSNIQTDKTQKHPWRVFMATGGSQLRVAQLFSKHTKVQNKAFRAQNEHSTRFAKEPFT